MLFRSRYASTARELDNLYRRLAATRELAQRVAGGDYARHIVNGNFPLRIDLPEAAGDLGKGGRLLLDYPRTLWGLEDTVEELEAELRAEGLLAAVDAELIPNQ